jgi:hypothetical protein
VSAFDNDDDDMPGPVVVKRTVYDAGMKLEAAVKAGVRGPAFENARDKTAECRAAGDAPGAAFWEEVFNFLMGRESVKAGTDIVILEEGETWDSDAGDVIRGGKRQRRSGKAT